MNLKKNILLLCLAMSAAFASHNNDKAKQVITVPQESALSVNKLKFNLEKYSHMLVLNQAEIAQLKAKAKNNKIIDLVAQYAADDQNIAETSLAIKAHIENNVPALVINSEILAENIRITKICQALQNAMLFMAKKENQNSPQEFSETVKFLQSQNCTVSAHGKFIAYGDNQLKQAKQDAALIPIKRPLQDYLGIYIPPLLLQALIFEYLSHDDQSKFLSLLNSKQITKRVSERLDLDSYEFSRSNQQFLKSASLGEYVLDNLTSDRVIQLRVKRQAGRDGAASCGYQALLNGIIVSRLLLSAPNQRNKLLYELTSEMLRFDLFGQEHSSWRTCVIRFRRKFLIQHFIYNILLCNVTDTSPLNARIKEASVLSPNAIRLNVCEQMERRRLWIDFNDFKESVKNRERKLCQSVLQTTAKLIVDKLERENKIHTYQNQLEISGSVLLNAISDAIKSSHLSKKATADKTRSPYAQHLWESNLLQIYVPEIEIQKIIIDYVNNPDSLAHGATAHEYYKLLTKIEQYFPLLKQIKIYITKSGISEDFSELAIRPSRWKNYIGGEGNGKPGEWLDNDELDPLIKLESEGDSLLSDIDLAKNNLKIIHITVPDPMPGVPQTLKHHLKKDPFGNVHKEADSDQYQENVEEVLGLVQAKDAQGIRVILFRYDRHWITCVVNKVGGHDAQYILTDSMGRSRIHEDRVKELITLLERRELTEYQNQNSNSCVIA